MKNKTVWFLTGFAFMLLASAFPAGAQQFYTGDGGRDISLTILAPKAAGIAKEQEYIPTLVQGEFVSNFSAYSAISVLDWVRLEEQYTQLLSGYYNDNSRASQDLGHLTPTAYIMGGNITKTASGYIMQISITKTADKMTAASYSGTCTFTELDNLTAVRRASLDLLQKMGVKPTEKTRTELAGAAGTTHVNAQTALAQGVTAQRNGALIEALNYFSEAVQFDPGLAEAADRSSTIMNGAFIVDLTYMTQGGTKKTDSILIFASEPRAAEREAEEQFKKTNNRSTFMRATARVNPGYINNSTVARPVPSVNQSVRSTPDGKMLFSVKVTYMTQGGTKRSDTITVQAADPRAAEREAEAQFRKTNSRSTLISVAAE